MERRALRRVDASPADVGRRLTLRYKLDPLGLNHAEAVGVLDRWSGTAEDGILKLRRRDDTSVRVPFDAVEVARVLPPELSAYRMQEMAEATWPPAEFLDMGCWRLRWTGEEAGRANSVRVAGPADRPLAAALKAVIAWYKHKGAPAVLQVPYPSPHDETFDSLGWLVFRRSRLMVSSTQRLFITTASARARGDMVLTTSDTPDDAWLAMLKGDPVSARRDVQPILTAPANTVFISCRRPENGELMGIGRGVIVGDWAGADNMVTAPDARRRGVATAVMGALTQWSAELGAARWFLRVHVDPEPALSLYDSLGFTQHHDYVYRSPEGAEVGDGSRAAPDD